MKELQRAELGALPGAHLSGLSTVISNSGQDRVSISTFDTLQSHYEDELKKPLEIEGLTEK